ncbi:MAG: ATP-binding protein [Calditrichia bacterium]
MAITRLKPADLRSSLPLNEFPFKTTDEIEPLDSVIGQQRAIRALDLALNMDHSGYNVFVTGASGTGKTTIVKDILNSICDQRPLPDDWIYLYNFDDPDAPQALPLPAGMAKRFQFDMAEMCRALQKEIPAAFNSAEYEQQKSVIVNLSEKRKRRLIHKLEAEARNLGVQLQGTAEGFESIVLQEGEPLSGEKYEQMPDSEKEKIDRRLEQVQQKINRTMKDVVGIERQITGEIKKLNRKIALMVVSRHIEEMQENYGRFSDLQLYLKKVEKDMIMNMADFVNSGGDSPDKKKTAYRNGQNFSKYHVNVLVDNSGHKGGPVVYEPNPTYNNLFGRIEKQVVMGSQVTDFTMIKSGSLHRANGGFLMLDAQPVLTNPYVYDSLKRAIKTREIRMEDVSDLSGYITSASLRPQPVPLNLKVVLTGSNSTYYTLQAYDPDFSKIFKIRADFDSETTATPENILKYARFIRRVCKEENLLPFHRSAVREVVFYGQRLVDDQTKLSLQFGILVGIIREANHYARREKRRTVRAGHVQQAITEYEYRNSMLEEKIHERYQREIIKLEVSGESVGQINGLAVYRVGGYMFGRPHRITAKTFIGTENVVNIERKVRLSGKLHDKGVLILNGFFNSKFGEYIPLSFSSSITFEQSYSTIDGDSASSTELYALLSSLSGIPLRQSVAVTGSVDQNGEVQAIGGVNQKIEGYFAVCRDKGLTGEQGVMIPRSNVESLMLKGEVIDAVKAGKFHIWAIDTIEDGLELLTGHQAGRRLRNGRFPKDSIYCLVENKLRTFTRRTIEFRKSAGALSKRKKGSSGPGKNQEENDGEES